MYKEWLLANRLGGYANLSTTCEAGRVYSSYLTASFDAPQDRAVIMDGCFETVNGKAVEWNGFSFDTVPLFSCIMREAMISKVVVLDHEENMVKLLYKIRAGAHDVQLSVEPAIVFRRPECAGTVEDTMFTVNEFSDQTFCYKPLNRLFGEREFSILIKGSDLEKDSYSAEPRARILAGLRYPVDEKTGFTGTGADMLAAEFTVRISAGTEKRFVLGCAACEGDSARTRVFADRLAAFMSEQVIEAEHLYYGELADSVAGYTLESNLLEYMEKRLTIMADKFIADRRSTGYKTILAGYPWFLDWGRDTMISFTGLVVSTGRYKDAADILRSFSRYLKNGLLPNVFPASGEDEPGYNTMDASLWYFYAVWQYLQATGDYDFVRDELYPGMKSIITAYKNGTDYGIGMDRDCLIHGGEDASHQITWMDVRIDGVAVTPRHGCPVEIQALWYNALRVMDELGRRFGDKDALQYLELAQKARDSFNRLFYNPEKKCLYDCIGGDPDRRTFDASLRPNQLWAVTMPFSMMEKARSLEILETCRNKLFVPLGIRSLASDEPGYHGRFEGDLRSRDSAYHMGTSWGFIFGAFAEGWLKTHDFSEEAVEFVRTMLRYYAIHMDEGCIDGIAEVFDGDMPREGKGCYTQAWSVAEVLRIVKLIKSIEK